MKMNKFLIFLLPAFFMLCNISALEVGGSFRIGNLSLDPINNDSVTAFDASDFSSWGLSAWGTHYINDQFKMEAGFFSDPILQNISYTLFSYTESFFSIGVGPFFGFFNSDWNTILKPGISTKIRIEIPAVLFLDFRTDSSQASRLVVDGDYIQERTDISFGFYVKNAVCTVNAFTKKYTQQLADYEVIYALHEYSFLSHLFQKNVPYRITLKFAYQNLYKQFIEAPEADPETYTLNSIVVGTKLELDITDSILVYIDMDNSVYSFGDDELSSTSIEDFAFRGSAGIELNLDRLISRPVMDEEFTEF